MAVCKNNFMDLKKYVSLVNMTSFASVANFKGCKSVRSEKTYLSYKYLYTSYKKAIEYLQKAVI